MRKATATVLVLAVAVLAALAFNPGPETHRTRIREAVGERSPIAGALGLGRLAAFASNYHSLGVASYTTVNGRTASWGAFGLVVVPAAGEGR
jgi:hypothetical protein